MTGDVLVESQKGPLLEQMHAAVVTSFDEPPHYLRIDVPTRTERTNSWSTSSLSASTLGCAPTRPASTTRAPVSCR